MRTVVHLSDLHFGRLDPAAVRALTEAVAGAKPDVIAISGDLTQRARVCEFQQARAFLDALPGPKIVVPGNHDVPLYDLLGRFVRGLHLYRTLITEDLEPFYSDEEVALAGVNTARSLTFKGGRINAGQAFRTRDRLAALPREVTKMIVTHHPFDLPEGFSERHLVGRARMALAALAECGADVFLSGHLHVSAVAHTAVRWNIAGLSALVVQAGTATSTRGRGEANSFNVLRVDKPRLTVERRALDSLTGAFALVSTESYEHSHSGWGCVPA